MSFKSYTIAKIITERKETINERESDDTASARQHEVFFDCCDGLSLPEKRDIIGIGRSWEKNIGNR